MAKIRQRQMKLTTMSTDMINMIYPIGSVYISITSTNPSTLFGGTWDRMPYGRFLLNEDGAGGFNLGASGGEINHTLTVGEMPSHTHGVPNWTGPNAAGFSVNPDFDTFTTDVIITSAAGSGLPHNNMPPYVVVFMWKRTA